VEMGRYEGGSMLIIHHNDNDGRLAAAIVAKYWDTRLSVRYLEMDYKDAFDPFKEVIAGEYVAIVDFSIKPDEMLNLLKITPVVVWLDHHKTAIDRYADFGIEIKGIREEGKRAGCALAWDYFAQNYDEDALAGTHYPHPLVVDLISDYDTWTLADDRSKPLNYGMQTVDTSPTSGIWQKLLRSDDETLAFVEGGRFVLNFVQNRGKELAASYGYMAYLPNEGKDNARLFVMHNPNPGMDWFWLLREREGIDAFARVAFDGKRYVVSLYSEGKVDVGELCKQYGGGGHPGAAGFDCLALPFLQEVL
jgi:oligoribonuclease NrnB/cAMP/cGMP phosphodiesterase (DHH superfamily)